MLKVAKRRCRASRRSPSRTSCHTDVERAPPPHVARDLAHERHVAEGAMRRGAGVVGRGATFLAQPRLFGEMEGDLVVHVPFVRSGRRRQCHMVVSLSYAGPITRATTATISAQREWAAASCRLPAGVRR